MGRSGAAVVVGVILLAGCGGSDAPSDDDQIRETVDQFTALVANGDDSCADYVASSGPIRGAMNAADRLDKSTGIDLGGACGFPEKTASQLASLIIARVTVSGEQATVAFDGQTTTASVVQEDGEWLVQNLSSP